MKLLETDTVFAFMDIGPIARGHCLVLPKRESGSELESGSGSAELEVGQRRIARA